MILLLPIAFIAGILTAFTPCALPVLPIILASSIEKRIRVAGVIIGLVTFFTFATLLLSSFVAITGIAADDIRQGSILILLLIGFLLIFPNIWERLQNNLQKIWHPPVLGKERGDFIGGFLTGASLGVVWTPCVGPVVAVVTALTAASPFSFTSWLITISYGLGIGLSFFVIAILAGKSATRLTFLKKNNKSLRQVFGLIVIITAVFIYFGADKTLRSFTLTVLPREWSQAGSIFQDDPFIQRKLEQLQNSVK